VLLYPGWCDVVLARAALLTPPAAPGIGRGVRVLFGLFIVALLVLIVIVLTWAIRRDKQGRAAWRQRQQDRNSAAGGDVPPAPRP